MSSFGIDLGTTTTFLSIAFGGDVKDSIESKIIPIKQEDRTGKIVGFSHLPSYAFFEENGSINVGFKAKSMGMNYPDRWIRAVKREMGRDVIPYTYKGISKSPIDIQSEYLYYVIKNGILEEDHKISQLTITVPASFTVNQRKDTLNALKKAYNKLQKENYKVKFPEGKEKDRLLISEPVAALLAFIADDLKKAPEHRQIDFDKSPNIMVYDIGGGTLDITIIKVSWKSVLDEREKHIHNLKIRVKEISRYNQFGGEDFDLKLAKWLHEKILEKYPELAKKEVIEGRESLKYKFINKAEEVKIDLNSELDFGEDFCEIYVEIPVYDETYTLEQEMTEEEYIDIMKDFLEESDKAKNCISPITKLLKKANMIKDNIDLFFPVGGMARLLPLRKVLKNYWGDKKPFIQFPVDDQAVAQGASIYSYLKNHYDFEIEEPAADAYYVKVKNGFCKILSSRYGQEGIEEVYLTGKTDNIILNIFSGEDCFEGNEKTIYPTLLYQGGTRINLNKEYPEGTEILIKMEYPQNSKIPEVTVKLNETGEEFYRKSFEEFIHKG